MEVIFNILAFILTIAVLVSFHEFGHFWVARRLGVKVLRFSIGFGKPLKRWQGKDGVEYVVAAIPLGGYVKMLDERESEVDPADAHLEFNQKPLLVRTAIVAAGPAFNFLLAIILYFLVFIIGTDGIRPLVGELEPQSHATRAGLMEGDEIIMVNGKETATWEEVLLTVLRVDMDHEEVYLQVSRSDDASREQLRLDLSQINLLDEEGDILKKLGITRAIPQIRPILGSIVPSSAADSAGLQADDEIVSFNGEAIDSWMMLVEKIRAQPGQAVDLSVQRDGQLLTLPVTIGRVSRDHQEVGHLGVQVKWDDTIRERYSTHIRYAPIKALGMALVKTWDVSVLTLKILWRLLIGEAALTNISGPVTIADFAGDSLAAGVVFYLAMLGLLSISIGILNLLPIPLLDGGHLLYYLIEFITGSPVSEKVQVFGQKIGISMIGALMVLAFYNDFYRLLH